MKEEEYIIINKTVIQKRIEELENEKLKNPYSAYYIQPLQVEINTLKQILSQSTPLIPEIEKAFVAGQKHELFPFSCENKQDYISNLKLDI